MTDTTTEMLALADCPIGLFMSEGGELCLKTEYGNNEGRIDAYIISSGEFFWGSHPQTIAHQRAQIVTPVDHEELLALRASGGAYVEGQRDMQERAIAAAKAMPWFVHTSPKHIRGIKGDDVASAIASLPLEAQESDGRGFGSLPSGESEPSVTLACRPSDTPTSGDAVGSAISSEELMKRAGADLSKPFERGPFPPEIRMLPPETLVDCEHCGGEGSIDKTIHVHKHGCGVSHPDVYSAPCQSCGGSGGSIQEVAPDAPMGSFEWYRTQGQRVTEEDPQSSDKQPLSPRDLSMIDQAWENHKAALPVATVINDNRPGRTAIIEITIDPPTLPVGTKLYAEPKMVELPEAAPAGEVVAWRWRYPDGDWIITTYEPGLHEYLMHDAIVEPLYATPPAITERDRP